MNASESVVRSYCFDALEGETIIQFANRVTGIVVTTDAHPLLNRMPQFLAVYCDYNIEQNYDARNGFRIYDDSLARGYENVVLVICYTNHV